MASNDMEEYLGDVSRLVHKNAEQILGPIDGWFDPATGLPKFDLTHEHHGLAFVVHTDLSLFRIPMPLAPSSSEFTNGVASKDVSISSDPNLRVRIFLPEVHGDEKLPIILYFHGGGFIFVSLDVVPIHLLCAEMCTRTKAVVVSADYRLAPEHRLPAQYEDSRSVLEWLRVQAQGSGVGAVESKLSSVKLSAEANAGSNDLELEPWLASHADFGRLFLAGDSAGGNIIHHLFMDSTQLPLPPLQISGLVFIQPFFGSLEPVPSELTLKANELPTSTGLVWKLALPLDADRSHPYCDVMPKLEERLGGELGFVDTFIAVGGHDRLRDRGVRYYEALRRYGVGVKLVEFEDSGHAFYVMPPFDLRDNLVDEIAQFVKSLA